jgi:hypothetical protein
MTKAERLLFWAAILEKPYRDAEGWLRPAVEANILAAEAMKFMADAILISERFFEP